MNVLSLFDGISCGRQTLKELGMKVDNYYASEIEQFGMDVANKNFPDTVQLGDVENYLEWDLPQIDLIIGGSPCQGFSQAGKQLNFDDPRSKLFFKFVECIHHFKPKYFMLENVHMKKEYQDVISNYLGCKPFTLKPSYFNVPQNRPRLFWTNIPLLLTPFLPSKVFLKDILEKDAEPTDYETITLEERLIPSKEKMWKQLPKTKKDLKFKVKTKSGIISQSLTGETADWPDNVLVSSDGIFPTLITGQNFQSMILTPNGKIRHLTNMEEERLEGLPDGYTDLGGKYKNEDKLRKAALGNCWAIPCIKYILGFIEQK